MQIREERLLRRVVVNPKIMVGKPIIKDTRIPVELILRLSARGSTDEEMLREYPQLRKEDVKAAVLFAAKIASREEYYPTVVK